MKDENRIGELYRDYLKRETARPELAREKKEFIARHFEEQPVAALRPAAFAPALSLVLLMAALIFLQRSALQTKMLETRPEATYTFTESVVPFPPSQMPSVVVKRISSRVGSTLVYQKPYQETPITIIWVFVPK